MTNAPDPPHWTLNSCFVAFPTIWVHFGAFGTIWLPISEQNEVASEFFTTNAPDPPHWTLNLGAFHTIWVHSGPFCCLTKHSAKWAKLVEKFVQQSRIGIFRKERTRSTPLDPKLTSWCVSYYLGAFGTVWLPYKTRCKTGRTSAKVRATKSRRNFSQRTHPIHPVGQELTFWCVSY